jgi:hypothetical protein
MRSPLLAAVLLFAALGATAFQPPDIIDDDDFPPPGVKAVRPGPPPGAKDGGPGGGDGGSRGEAPRMARLKQLTFDRRPSAILKAWAPPPKDANKWDAIKTPVELEVEAFQKDVVRGEWAKVKAYLVSLPDEEAIAAYQQMLQSLRQAPSPLAGTLPPGAMIQPPSGTPSPWTT